jgi:hypothetical protein
LQRFELPGGMEIKVRAMRLPFAINLKHAVHRWMIHADIASNGL